MNKENIKIFVTYKDKHKIIETDIIKPIQTGRAIAAEIFDEMLGDDTGDNISTENLEYAELTAQYWAWKNYETIGNPDYIGFMHYRRHFIFNEKYKHFNKNNYFKHGYSAYEFENITNEYLSNIHLKDEYIQKVISDTDIIFVKKANAKYLGYKNGLEDFLKNCYGSNKEDFEKCMKIVLELYPEYSEEVKELQKGPYRYFYNMFIMKKEIFFEYSEFLFSVLVELKKNINTEFYSEKAKRVLGYMGEFLLSLFAFKMSKNKSLKIKELYSSFISKTTPESTLTPAFPENNICIAMSSSNEYTPYLSVCLESLKQASSEENNYDIIIFERNITEENKKILKSQIESKNISLRFYNPTQLIKNYQLKFPSCYNLECYFRLVSPVVCKNYEKIIFTDIDLLFKHDIKDLYEVDLGNLPLGAAQDYIYGIFLNNPNDIWKTYALKTLELDEPYKYFNTGVMLINVKEFNQNNYSTKLLELVSKKQYKILEQDGLNKFFKTNIKYIDSSWNFPTLNKAYKSLFKFMPYEFTKKYNKDKENPKIIHFAGGLKPWFYPEEEFANVWWQYAKQTPFYELILKKMCDKNKPTIDLLKDAKHYKSNILRYWKYKILQNFVFGKTRKRYTTKKHIFKTKIRNAQVIT